jgi:proline dehydrogenase
LILLSESDERVMDNFAHRIWRACWMPLARFAARAYVAGPSLADAVRAARRLSTRRFASTVGFWNRGDESPREVLGQYLAAIEAVGREGIDCYLSIKAPALGLSRPLLIETVQAAAGAGVRVHLDSLGPETAERTLALLARLADHHEMGYTLPGRWRRSLGDAERATALGLRVRVVKGQFADHERAEMDPRNGVLAIVERLAGRARHVAVATHDASLAEVALGTLRAAATPCELELLFGLPLFEPVRVAAKLGVSVRLYVPYGEAWLPYALSQARANPRVLWWAARDLARGGAWRLPPVGGVVPTAAPDGETRKHHVARQGV